MNRTGVEQYARQLADSIKISEPYLEYVAACEKIKKEPKKLEEMNRVRKAFFLKAAEKDPVVLKKELDELQIDYKESLAKKWLIDFMEKEQRYCKLIKMVQTQLDEVMDFDLDFLRDE